jgi:hypothetical protein
LNRIEHADDGQDRYFLIPYNATSFHSGWFSKTDFIDWSNNTGKIIKGQTVSDKQKFIEYAKFEQQYGPTLLSYYAIFHVLLDDGDFSIAIDKLLHSYVRYLDYSEFMEHQSIIKYSISANINSLSSIDVNSKHDLRLIKQIIASKLEYLLLKKLHVLPDFDFVLQNRFICR